jgi:uncharacterized protein (DUF362 family)
MAENNNKISRRDFLKSAAMAGITIAGGSYFVNRNPVPRKANLLKVRSYGVANSAGLFAVAKGENPSLVVRRAVDGVGGIGKFVTKGDKVLIKVNCAFARPSWAGATTSPEVTGEIVKLCYEAGAAAVRVTDNPISDPKSCFLKSGLSKAVTDAGGEIILPNPSDFRVVEVSKGVIGPWEVYHEPLRWCDKLIGVPTVKTHNLCGASLGMKNWYGFIGGSRSRFHQDIHHVITELAQFITPTLVILDGTRMLTRNGPTGGSAQDVVVGNTVVASTDQVAVDAFGVEMLGLDKNTVHYIQLAEEKGLGKSDYRKLPGFKEVQS